MWLMEVCRTYKHHHGANSPTEDTSLTVTSSLLLCLVENMRKKAVTHSVPSSIGGARPPSTCSRTPSTIGRLTCSIRSIACKAASTGRPGLLKVQSSVRMPSTFTAGIALFEMDPEQEVREYQREYLDFLDDEVSAGSLRGVVGPFWEGYNR